MTVKSWIARAVFGGGLFYPILVWSVAGLNADHMTLTTATGVYLMLGGIGIEFFGRNG